MRTIIDRIIAFCEMRAKVMGIVVANTEKTLRESAPDGRRAVGEHTESTEEFTENHTRDGGQTFEERLDEEVKQTAAYIGGRLKHPNDGLDEECESSGPKVLFDNAGLRVSNQI